MTHLFIHHCVSPSGGQASRCPPYELMRTATVGAASAAIPLEELAAEAAPTTAKPRYFTLTLAVIPALSGGLASRCPPYELMRTATVGAASAAIPLEQLAAEAAPTTEKPRESTRTLAVMPALSGGQASRCLPYELIRTVTVRAASAAITLEELAAKAAPTTAKPRYFTLTLAVIPALSGGQASRCPPYELMRTATVGAASAAIPLEEFAAEAAPTTAKPR